MCSSGWLHRVGAAKATGVPSFSGVAYLRFVFTPLGNVPKAGLDRKTLNLLGKLCNDSNDSLCKERRVRFTLCAGDNASKSITAYYGCVQGTVHFALDVFQAGVVDAVKRIARRDCPRHKLLHISQCPVIALQNDTTSYCKPKPSILLLDMSCIPRLEFQAVCRVSRSKMKAANTQC